MLTTSLLHQSHQTIYPQRKMIPLPPRKRRIRWSSFFEVLTKTLHPSLLQQDNFLRILQKFHKKPLNLVYPRARRPYHYRKRMSHVHNLWCPTRGRRLLLRVLHVLSHLSKNLQRKIPSTKHRILCISNWALSLPSTQHGLKHDV